MKCLEFPIMESRPAINGATLIQVMIGRAREHLGRALNRLGIPGPIADVVVSDEVTGFSIEAKRGHLYTRLSVNGRDFYFDRLTGRFGGTGSGCR